jgi:Ca2+-binding EF-hand superfamily protein
MTRKAIAIIAASFVVGTISTAALAASADKETRTLIQMMDKDKNGTVSKEEFMEFMSAEFDRLDANKSGTLEHRELRRVRSPDWPLGDCYKRGFPQCRGTGGQ